MEMILWVIIIGMGIFAVFMPKRISKAEIYISSFFAFSFGITSDCIFDLLLNLYGYYDVGVDLKGFLYVILVYTIVNALFLNYYPYDKSRLMKTAYILSWSLFALVYEYAAVQTPIFYYDGWRLRYSLVLYPVTFVILLFNLKIYRWLLPKK